MNRPAAFSNWTAIRAEGWPNCWTSVPIWRRCSRFLIARTEGPSGDWRQEIQLGLPDKPLVLVCRGSDLPPETGGQVVVFDDVTVLDQAQREAAWAEVARRLAHEVKNPLTPIQLAAERLKYKLDPVLDEEQRALLDRATTTIRGQGRHAQATGRCIWRLCSSGTSQARAGSDGGADPRGC